MEPFVDEIHRYHGYHGSEGMCRIRIFREAGRTPIILCSQPPEMVGTSITHLAEYLAAEVASKYLPAWETPRRSGATPEALPFLWIEHYPGQPYLEENCAFVRFEDYRIERLPAGYWPGQRSKLGQPIWRHVRESAVAALLGRPLTD